MAAQAERGVPISTLCPKYLHTNSTSHTWPFSAIAELIDNAYDTDVNAKQLWIDKTVVKRQQCLTFMDNGNGLDHKTMHKMLSFGYSDKTTVNGQKPIGFYGNGFKSGSMRLGQDAIVFSKSKNTSCVGMLSQTYLKTIGAQQIIVPIVCFEKGENNEIKVREEYKVSLQDILQYSPFKTEEELHTEINAIGSTWSSGTTGTRIIIWNLRSTATKPTEFDFETDRYDIRIPSDIYEAMQEPSQQLGISSHIPESVYSLRAYCSILYLKPRMQIIIRGQKVKSQLIAKSLAYIRTDHYKPIFLSKRVKITFGYNTKSKDQYGVMMYHKNRLIKAYERVGCQIKASHKGVGVIGVIECDFLEPTHNKQSFNETDKYRRTMNSLGTKLEEYWQEIRHKRKQEDPNSIPVEDIMKRPDQNWVQCDKCLQWRKLPDGIDCSKLPDKWFCSLNPDPQFRSCTVDEEPEDSDDDQPYRKTYKQQERKNKEKKRQKDEEDSRRLAELTRPNQARQQQNNLSRRLREAAAHGPLTPTTPRSRFNAESPKGGAIRAETFTISQDACSPSSNSGLPVISNVCSLSTGSPRGKRTQPATPQSTPKRPKVHPRSVEVIPLSSPSVPADNDDDTDDDIFILENASTPKPNKPTSNLSKVKTEKEESEVSMQLEYTDDTAMDDHADTNAAGTVSAAVGSVASVATQTMPKVKEEEMVLSQHEKQEGAEQRSATDLNRLQQTLENSVTHQDGVDDAGPSCADTSHMKDSPHPYPDVIEIQKQQDKLVELMQATAQERDRFKEQFHKLTSQLQDAEKRLQELSQQHVKKESIHRASQTKETQGGKDYRNLIEEAKQKIDELIKDKEALLSTAEDKPSAEGSADEDLNGITLQVDRLLRELDRSNKERDVLRAQLESLEEEKAHLASECEELRLSLQQEREKARLESTTPHRATHSSAHTNPGAAGSTGAACGSDSSSDSLRTLMELRHNVGRLLISHVPALDLEQVNYECNVIDEILEQCLSNPESLK